MSCRGVYGVRVASHLGTEGSTDGRRSPLVVLVSAALVVDVLLFSLTTIPGIRPRPGFSTLADGWLQGSAYVLTALLALLWAVRSHTDRWVPGLVAAALAARALAFVVYLTVVRNLDPVPYPSVADAGWLLMCALLLAALVLLARRSFTYLSANLVLDGIVGGLAASAVAVALLYGTLVDLTAPGTPSAVVITNLAYPIADFMLLLMTFGVLLAFQWKPPPAAWLLALGVAGFAVVDTVFLAQVAAGTFRPGTPLSALSLGATALIAFAGRPPRSTRRHLRRDALPGLVMPCGLGLACASVLVFASFTAVPLGAIVFASAGLAIAAVRANLAFRDALAMADARREARTDELTGLANRRAFNEALASALRGRDDDSRLALLIIDLDNFKAINDALGHHRGDELLALVAPRIQLALRADDFLARIGGDEFAILLDGADGDLAAQIAGRIRAGLRRPLAVATRELVVGASVGIAVFPEDGDEPSELLRRADLAMYDSKAAHSGHGFYRPDSHEATRERLHSVERLRAAIENDELVLHYQPQVWLATGQVVAVEALVRWQHPDAGLLSPAAFLPQAERGGLMRLLTLNVLEQAIRQCADWRRLETPVRVAVNLSVSNLLDVELPAQAAMLLESYGVPGDALELELTEDLFMADPARGRMVMAALGRLGITIVVDDYGTGYSTLGYLRDLQDIGGLKLDGSFVTEIDSEPRQCAIVTSTIALARSLDLSLVAEGVESASVRDCLAELGCERAQGYFFCRPVPAPMLRLGFIERARAGG